MKRIYFLMITAVALMVAFSGCKKEPDDNGTTPENSVGTFKLAEIVDAAAAAYKTFEDEGEFPESFKAGDKDLTTPQYQYAICKALVNISEGKTEDIAVLNYKPAAHPDRDSYDKETIAVKDGPKNGDETEDLVNIATRMLARMKEELAVPNQTNFMRNDNPIAFSTNRATTVISRELAYYKANNKLEAEVSSSFKAPAASMKAFAQEYVKIIDVWQNNVGTIDRLSNWELAEEGDNDIVENAHYIPNDFKITVGKREYNTGEMLEIAVRSYLLLRGIDGTDVDAVGPGTFPKQDPVATLNSPIPETHEFGWNTPLIETSNGGYLSRTVDGMDVYGQVDPLILENWAVRSVNWSFGNENRWTNFCSYPREPITGYKGIFSSGRALLTYAFFFKYMLDNNLDKADNLDASVTIRSELFGLETAGNDNDIKLATEELIFNCKPQTKEALFSAKSGWTATPSDNWISVEPANGQEGTVTLKVTVTENTGAAREGKVTIKGSGAEGVDLVIKQSEYFKASAATLKEFAAEFVKGLKVWENTVGDVDADGTRNQQVPAGAWKDVHFIPIQGNPDGPYYNLGNNQYDPKWKDSIWKLNVAGSELSSSQAWEIAIRGLLNMVTSEGEAQLDNMDDRNKPFTLTDAGGFNSTYVSIPSNDNQWGNHPWYEGGSTVKDNGAEITEVGVDFMVKVGAWHIVRGLIYNATSNTSPLGMIGNFQEFGTTNGTLILGNYVGLICPMRELLILMRIYKYLLDNNIDSNVYTAIKDKKFDFDLYGEGLPAGGDAKPYLFKTQWLFSAAKMEDYTTTFGKGMVMNPAAGDGGYYIDANGGGNGRITYVQVDKTDKAGSGSLDNIKHNVGDTGHPFTTGTWLGDYWYFTAWGDTEEIPAGAKVHVRYIARSSAAGPKYWMAEYFDGNEWKPAPIDVKSGDEAYNFATPTTATVGEDTFSYNIAMKENGSSNTTIECTFTLAAPVKKIEFRQVDTGHYRASNGTTAIGGLGTATTRLAGSDTALEDGSYSSPLIEVIE